MTDPLPLVSVVIPALNAAETLGAQLEALAGQTVTVPWEIVVVDNNSTDATAAVATRTVSHTACVVRVVHEPVRGLNRARNAGVRAARAPRVAICDADDRVAPGWLAALIDRLDHDDIVCGHLDVRSINSAEILALRGWSDTDAPFPSVGREFGFLDQVICGNVAFARDLWLRLDGFDERFARGGDDVDFGWRAQLAGCSVASCPDAVLHYRARGDLMTMFKQYARDGHGAAHLYSRYSSSGMPRRRLVDAVRVVGWLARQAPFLPRADLSTRGHFVRVAGKQWGRITGSIRHRVVYL